MNLIPPEMYEDWSWVLRVPKERKPLVLPVPPSDNQRKTFARKRNGQLIIKRGMPMMITSGIVNKYIKTVENIEPEHRRVRPPCFLVYRLYFKDRRRDAQNCQKVLSDALYGQDKQVYPVCLPEAVDRADPRVEVWIVPLVKEGK